MTINSIKSLIKRVPNYPKNGIIFYDISPIFLSPCAFSKSLYLMESLFSDKRLKIASPESRGFIIGSALADRLRLPFVLIRKSGKLPRENYKIDYKTEYSTDTLSIHKDDIKSGDNIILIDDILATGGTLRTCAKLIEKCDGRIEKIITLCNIKSLSNEALKNLSNYPYQSIIEL